MSIRPGGPSTPSRAEQLIVRNMAGLIVLAVVLLLGGIMVAAVLRSQARTIDALEERIDVLEANRNSSPAENKTAAEPVTSAANKRDATPTPSTTREESNPAPKPQTRLDRSRIVPPGVDDASEDLEDDIIAKWRQVIQTDKYGNMYIADRDAGPALLKQIAVAAERQKLSPRVLARGAVCALLFDEMELSQKLLDQAEAGNGPTAPYYETLARRRLQEGQTDAAIVAATRLADKTNNSPTALVLLADAYRLRDETGLLASTLTFGRSWNGLTPPDQLLLARAYAAMDDEQKLKAALARLPDDLDKALQGDAEELRAAALLLSGDAEGALEKLENLDAAQQERAEWSVWAGRALRDLGRRGEARDAFEKAAQLAPNRAIGYYYQGEMAMNDRDPNTANTMLERAVTVAPQYAPAWRTWGMLALNNKQVEPAFDRLARAIEAAPQLALSHFYMAIALAKTQRKEETAEALQQAVQLDPSLADSARLSPVFINLFGEKGLDDLLTANASGAAAT